MSISSPSASERAAAWLASRMNPDGSLRDASSINEYYKGVGALAAAGRPKDAERLLDFVARRFLKPDGDLDGTGCEWFEQFRIYCHAWIAIGALQLGRFDVSEPLLDFLAKFHDPKSGGFFPTIANREARGEQEMMTTGVAGIAQLWGGRKEIARGVFGWMKAVWAAQPGIERGLHFVWNASQGRVVTQFPADKAGSYRVDPKAAAGWFFQYGVGSAFCSAYAAATRDPAALKLAQEFVRATRFFGEDAYKTPQIGKVGWGAAWTARLTRDAADLAVRDKVYASLTAAQSPDGSWPGQTVYGKPAGSATAPSLDITGEFTALTAWMERPVNT